MSVLTVETAYKHPLLNEQVYRWLRRCHTALLLFFRDHLSCSEIEVQLLYLKSRIYDHQCHLSASSMSVSELLCHYHQPVHQRHELWTLRKQPSTIRVPERGISVDTGSPRERLVVRWGFTFWASSIRM